LRTPEPELSCYGKLPLHKEFLRIRCFGGPASYLRQWVDAGFALAVQRAGNKAYSIGSPLQLMICPERDKHLLVGRLRDSSDSGHERPFPFAAYCAIPLKQLSKRYDEQLGQTAELFAALRRFDESLTEMSELATFQAASDAARLPAPAAAGSAPGFEPFTLRSLAERTVGVDDFPRAVWRIRTAAKALQAGGQPATRLPALCIPLAPLIDTVAQAALWWSLLEHNGFREGFKTPVSCAFTETGDAPGRLWILARPLRADDFHLFGTEPDGYLAPADATLDAASPLGYSEFKGRVEDLLSADAPAEAFAQLHF
jgi:hypothetical protein